MDNRSNLLAVAMRLFASRGYDAVGVQEIVEAAGVTKPTLYHYFGSKKGLLEALLDEYLDSLYASIVQAAFYQHDLPLTLQRVVRAYFDFANAHPTLYRLQLGLWFAPANSDAFRAVAQWNEKQQQVLETLFLQAVQDHGNIRGRHQAYAATLLGMIHTYIGLALNGYVTLDDELVYRALHQYMHGIFS